MNKKLSRILTCLVGIVLLVTTQAQDWESFCPDTCRCRWYNNKKEAVCREADFTMIPSQLSPEINVLDMTDNSITVLGPNTFRSINLINLHKLVLANNRISSVDKTAFEGLRLVFDLDLSNNLITWLHTKTFSGMEKMRKLILSGNRISRLEAYQFPPLPNLGRLVIDDCRLSYVNNLAFSNLPSLTSVSMKGNNLTTLQPELFMDLDDLRSVQLQDNKWQCDCKLRKLVGWNKKQQMGEAQLACHSPQRLSGKNWNSLDSNDLACAPVIRLPKVSENLILGGNTTVKCGATGEPLPSIEWTLDGRVLSNYSRMPSTDPDMLFFVVEDFIHGTLWLNLTVTHLRPHQVYYPDSLLFNCVARNPAELVERNVTIELQAPQAVVLGTTGANSVYLIIAIVCVVLLILLATGIILYCCWRRHRKRKQKNHETNGCLVERNNILIVNPMETPNKTEHYEKVPQAEIELTDLTKNTHTSFNEMNYPEERNGRVRSPLTVLEVEEFDQASQKLLLDVSGNTATTLDLPSTYPDLLDNVRFTRAISPTQLSYHSLMTPSPDWRYSYAHPTEFTNSSGHGSASQALSRPGYVTLPRRPRSQSSSSTSPLERPKVDPIYDTLGPRTTADGTSKTELNRLANRSPLASFNPLISPSGLPKHYAPIMEEGSEYTPQQSRTLPRLVASQPNRTMNHQRLNGPSSMSQADPKHSGGSPQSPLSSIEGKQPETSLESTLKKKVPPKPPPKPSNKRLSISSTHSESNSRRSFVDCDKTHDEGSDGTEV